jgi:hypothetical protein
MNEKNPSTFEPNSYMDRLLELREKDPAHYASLDSAVVKVLDEYAEEKRAADQKLMSPQHGE